MGNETSLPMEMATNFDAEEIKRLGKRFKKLDLDNSGALSVEEFMSLPELQQNPLVQRVIDIFDEDGNGEVDFKEFIQGVSQFSVKGDKASKLRFAFRYELLYTWRARGSESREQINIGLNLLYCVFPGESRQRGDPPRDLRLVPSQQQDMCVLVSALLTDLHSLPLSNGGEIRDSCSTRVTFFPLLYAQNLRH